MFVEAMPSVKKAPAEESPLGRYARWTGSMRTLKNKNGWPTQAVKTSAVFLFHLENIISCVALCNVSI